MIKSIAFPKLNHVIANLTTPEWFVKEAQACIFYFLWSSKNAKVKNDVVVNSYNKGGLQIPHVESYVMAQKAIWVKRMLMNESAAWLELLQVNLPDMLFTDLLRCNIDSEDLSETIPTFYIQVLYAWYSLHDETKNRIGNQ